MNGGEKGKDAGSDGARRAGQVRADWASGLRQLYDSVVEEPLPDMFAKLLDELDKADD